MHKNLQCVFSNTSALQILAQIRYTEPFDSVQVTHTFVKYLQDQYMHTRQDAHGVGKLGGLLPQLPTADALQGTACP